MGSLRDAGERVPERTLDLHGSGAIEGELIVVDPGIRVGADPVQLQILRVDVASGGGDDRQLRGRRVDGEGDGLHPEVPRRVRGEQRDGVPLLGEIRERIRSRIGGQIDRGLRIHGELKGRDPRSGIDGGPGHADVL